MCKPNATSLKYNLMNFITAVARSITSKCESEDTSDFGLKSFLVVVYNRY